jgi:hypothetical protein
MDTTIDPKELISPIQAARLRNLTKQRIYQLIEQEILPVVEIGGRRFLRLRDVLSYRSVLGRPRKSGGPQRNEARLSKRGSRRVA